MKKEKKSFEMDAYVSLSRVVKNSLNYDHMKTKYEVFTKPSMTVPDMTLTVREIFNRYARGAALPVKNIYYDETEDMPDVRTLDLAEQEVWREIAEDEILKIRKPVVNPKNKDHEKKTEDVPGKPQGEDENQDV